MEIIIKGWLVIFIIALVLYVVDMFTDDEILCIAWSVFSTVIWSLVSLVWLLFNI